MNGLRWTWLCFGFAMALAAWPARARDKKNRADPEVSEVTRELRHTSLKIDDSTRSTLQEIRVAGGASTVLSFTVALAPGGTFVADVRNLLEKPIQTDRTVVLLAKKDLPSPLALTVTLADGTVLTFKLVTDPLYVDAQVDVAVDLNLSAPPDSAAALKTSLAAVRAQLDECEANSDTAGIEKVSSLLLGQNLEAPGAFARYELRGGDKQNRLLVQLRWSYRLVGTTYVVLTVENRDPVKAWMLDHAELRVDGGSLGPVKVIAVESELSVLPPDTVQKVVIAFPSPALNERERVSLSLYEKGGARHVTLSGLDL